MIAHCQETPERYDLHHYHCRQSFGTQPSGT
jgi:hypothetical protein